MKPFNTWEPTVGSGSHTPALDGSTPSPGTISRDISEAIFASIEQSSTAFRIRRAIARCEVKVSPEFAALAATGDDAALIAAATNLPSASILSAQVETVSAVPAAPVVPAPAAKPRGGAQSAKVAELEIRREGTEVYARLMDHVCGGTSMVPTEHGDVYCPTDGCKDGLVQREVTHDDWSADFMETTCFWTDAERAEAEAAVERLCDEARALDDEYANRPFFCVGSRTFRHGLIGIERADFKCPTCGAKARPRNAAVAA